MLLILGARAPARGKPGAVRPAI